MMKAATLLAALAFFPSFFFAQNPSAANPPDMVRALENQLSQAPNDTAKLAILAKLAAAFLSIDLAKSRQLADEMLALAQKTRHGEGQARAFSLKTRQAQAEERLTEAIQFSKKAAHIFDSLGLTAQKMQAERKIAAISIRSGRYNDALEIYFRQLPELEKNGSRVDLFFAYQNIGIVYHDQKRIAEALKFDRKALEVAEEMKSAHLLGQAVSNIGWDLAKLPDSFPRAEQTMLRALAIFEKADTCPSCQSRLHSFLADHFLEQKRIGEALVRSEKAVSLGRKTRDELALAEALLLRAQALNLTNRPTEAAPLIDEAQTLLEGGDDNEITLDFFKTKAQNAFALGKIDEGNAALLKAFAWKDSLAKQTFDERLSEATVKFETDSIAAQAEILASKNQNLAYRNSLAMLSLGFLATLFLGGLWVFFRLKSQKKRIEQQKNALQTLNATKDKFFAIIAHDLRGPIISFHGLIKKINWLIARGEADRVAELGASVDEAAAGLNRLLDNLLSWAMIQRGTMPHHPEAIALREEAEAVVGIFKNSLEARRISLKIDVPEGLAVRADRNALSCILRNLTDNAAKYAPDGSEINLRAERENAHVAFTVSDNGVGIPPEQLAQIFEIKKTKAGRSQGTGLGLVLCRELAEQNEGRIRVESGPERGTAITVVLPLARKAA